MEHTTIDSPIGPLRARAADGAVTRLTMDASASTEARPPTGVLADLREQLEAYFAGALRTFDIPLAPAGAPFEQRVWAALTAIPYGETRSYGALAAQIGAPTAARAVGLANGRNPIAILVPCHRVLGADGSLTGYAGGLHRKRMLLDLEAGVLPLVG